MKCTGLRILVAALTLFGAAKLMVAQPPWTPITPFTGAGPSSIWWLYGMDHGGVAEDVQLVYHDDPDELQNQVWTACMNGGFYRAVWNETQEQWGDWGMYLPAKKAFGVDAIEVGGVEYVLCASQGLGLRYAESFNSAFGPSWDWPNPNDYPQSWYKVGTNDAAFYWPTTGTPETPEQKFYVILTSGVSGGNPGIYCWQGTQPIGFVRVDADELDLARQYSHFYRDLATPNVVYVTSPNGIYKLSGHYGRETFEKLPFKTKLENLPIARPPKNLPPLPSNH